MQALHTSWIWAEAALGPQQQKNSSAITKHHCNNKTPLNWKLPDRFVTALLSPFRNRIAMDWTCVGSFLCQDPESSVLRFLWTIECVGLKIYMIWGSIDRIHISMQLNFTPDIEIEGNGWSIQLPAERYLKTWPLTLGHWVSDWCWQPLKIYLPSKCSQTRLHCCLQDQYLSVLH